MDDAARLWGKDRQSLGICRDRHAALVQAERAVEAQGKEVPR